MTIKDNNQTGTPISEPRTRKRVWGEYFGGEDEATSVAFDWESMCPSFKLEEIFSPECMQTGKLYCRLEAVMKLQRFRDHLMNACGTGLFVNFNEHRRRGVRSMSEQLRIVEQYKTAAEVIPMHVCGVAFDVTPTHASLTLEDLKNKALAFGYKGVGFYPKAGFVHLDIRDSLDGKPVIWTVE